MEVLLPESVQPLSAGEPILTLEGAWKAFGHVVALRGVDFDARPAEITAIVGDNGAGKSTLVKVLSGVYRIESGEFRIRGELVRRADPRVVQRLGVSTVFQDLALVDTLDVATNMYLAQPITVWKVLQRRSAMFDGAANLLRDLGVRLPSVRIPVGDLSGGQRQSVAIARTVLQDTPVIMLDEPTAALGVRETAQVGTIVAHLKEKGKAVIIVSHDLDFVFKQADRIYVMRLGEVQGVRQTIDTDYRDIIGLITGVGNPDQKRGRERSSV